MYYYFFRIVAHGCVAPARRHVCTLRWSTVGFLWCEEHLRDEEGGWQDALPALTCQQNHIIHVLFHTPLCVREEMSYSKCSSVHFVILANAFEHSFKQNTQSLDCLNISIFQRWQSGMSWKSVKCATDNWERINTARCLHEAVFLCIMSPRPLSIFDNI